VAYSDANVAAYLTTNVPTGTYSNTNVASYLSAGISSNVKTTANVIAPNFLFANGVNILSTVGGSSYGNTQVAAYLTTASISTTGNVAAGNIIGTQYGNAIGTTATYSGNITAGNITANQYGNAIGTTATYSGNITASNIIATNTVTAVNIQTTGTYGNITGANVISANTVTVTTYVRTQPVLFAALPAAAAAGTGARAFITDANTFSFASAVTGGGGYYVPVFSNGSSWFVG
jgi:hypothetical protein